MFRGIGKELEGHNIMGVEGREVFKNESHQYCELLRGSPIMQKLKSILCTWQLKPTIIVRASLVYSRSLTQWIEICMESEKMITLNANRSF